MSVLDDKINRFKNDVDIAHQIIHGDVTTEVGTEGGPVPSFAKAIADNAKKFQENPLVLLGMVAKSFSFESSLVWRVTHNFGTQNFIATKRNAQGVELYAHTELLNENEFQIEFTEAEAGTVDVIFFKNA